MKQGGALEENNEPAVAAGMATMRTSNAAMWGRFMAASCGAAKSGVRLRN